MSELSKGVDTPGKEPDPNRRRKRRFSRKKRKNKGNSQASGLPQNELPSESAGLNRQVGQNGKQTGSGPHESMGDHVGRNFRPREIPKHARNHQRPLYAALDLGTNNCRLLIATPQQRGRFRVVDGFSRIVRLGEGLSSTGRLGDQAMDRAVDALKICGSKLANRQIRNQRLIATEACRQAENGEEFLSRVKEETGLELEVVSREMEARLAAEGCGALMDRKSAGGVLFDIGGGSSELILVDAAKSKRNRISEQIVSWTSLPMGVVTLAEKFGGRDVSRKMFDEMVASVLVHIESFSGRDAVDHVFQGGNAHLLGTSGTVTTLAGIHLDLPRYDRRRVDGLWMTADQIDTIIERLIGMSFEERAANPCIGRERADLVLAGCAILNAIREIWPTKRLRVADRGLREGLLTQMMHKDRSWTGHAKRRWSRKRRMKRAHSAGGNQ